MWNMQNNTSISCFGPWLYSVLYFISDSSMNVINIIKCHHGYKTICVLKHNTYCNYENNWSLSFVLYIGARKKYINNIMVRLSNCFSQLNNKTLNFLMNMRYNTNQVSWSYSFFFRVLTSQQLSWVCIVKEIVLFVCIFISLLYTYIHRSSIISFSAFSIIIWVHKI